MSGPKINDPVVEQDLILVHVDGNPAFFARVEGFETDVKKGWWRVKLLVLQVPPSLVTWILRREQINGEEFTMSGTPIRIDKVVVPEEEQIPKTQAEKGPGKQSNQGKAAPESKPDSKKPSKQARILSLGDRNEDDDD